MYNNATKNSPKIALKKFLLINFLKNPGAFFPHFTSCKNTHFSQYFFYII